MKKKYLLITIIILTMGLFSFFKKDKSTEANPNSTILGMILLKKANSLNMEGVLDELQKKWEIDIQNTDSDDETAIINIDGYKVAIGNISAPIPTDEVKTAAAYNYFWTDAVEQTSKHEGHIILSIMNSGRNPIQENILFSKVAAAVMNNSKSIGIYIGSRTLVLSKDFYLTNLEMMTEDSLPLYLWVYFGLRSENGRHSVYTYGLTDFGKKEMEIVESVKDLEELSEIMYNMSHYVIAYNVTLKDGETIGMSAEQKLQITESEGKFLEGKTLKIKY
jgi:hypothetical protein